MSHHNMDSSSKVWDVWDCKWSNWVLTAWAEIGAILSCLRASQSGHLEPVLIGWTFQRFRFQQHSNSSFRSSELFESPRGPEENIQINIWNQLKWSKCIQIVDPNNPNRWMAHSWVWGVSCPHTAYHLLNPKSVEQSASNNTSTWWVLPEIASVF